MFNFIPSGYDDNDIAMMSGVYDRVLAELRCRLNGSTEDPKLQDAIAQAILSLASAGQRHPEAIARYATYSASVVLRSPSFAGLIPNEGSGSGVISNTE